MQQNRFLTGLARASLCLAALLLSSCSSSPPIQLYQLRAEPPEQTAPDQPIEKVVGNWSLGPVLLPDYLDRDAIVRPTGQSALSTLAGQRWAEPLRDAVPRLLLQDLAQLRGAEHVWRAPAPAGVKIARQLRVDVQRLDAGLEGRTVVLQARWTLIDASGSAPVLVRERRIEVDSADAGTDALVSAHRVALWRLAQEIARTAPP